MDPVMEDTLKEMKRTGRPGFILVSDEKEVLSVLRRYPWGKFAEGVVIASIFNSWLEDGYRRKDPPANRLFIRWDGTLLGADWTDYAALRTVAFGRSCEDFLKAHGFPGKGFREGVGPRDVMGDTCGTGRKKRHSDEDQRPG